MNRSARLLLAASFISNVGSGMYTLTVGKLLYDHTGSAAVFGVVIVLEYASTFLFQLIAGPWVDRGNPKWSCVGASVARGGFILLASLMLATPQQTAWVIATSLVIQAAKPFYRAAQFALAPAVVEPGELTRLNSYNSISVQSGQLIGVALVGPVIAFGGVTWAFALNGAGFLLSAVAAALISVDVERAVTAHAERARGWLNKLANDWLNAIRIVRSSRALAWLVALCAGDYLLVGLVNLLIAPIVSARYGGNSYWLSMLDGAFALGAMLTAFIVDALVRGIGARNAVLLGLGGQTLFFSILAASGGGMASLFCMFGIGAANAISCLVLLGALQERVPGPYRGRVVSFRSLLLAGVGAGVMPLVSRLETVSLPAALAASAAVGAMFWTIALLIAHPRRYGAAMLGEYPPAASAAAID